ncbi:MAG: hypothetical protein ACUVWS_18005 [Roseiflexus sp.]
MRNISLVLLLIVGLVISGCGNPIGRGNVPADAIIITITYSPEKDEWLKDRIAAFNRAREQVDGRLITVEGINKSSGAARTEIRNEQLKTTIWSPSASTWLEVLRYESGNPSIAVSNRPLVLTPVVISMWRPMAEAMGWPGRSIVGQTCWR